MTMEVLLSQQQITAARQALVEKGISAVDSRARRFLRSLRLLRGVSVGDEQKSWDVLAAIRSLERHVAKNEPIADIGCFASEVLISLHKLGYSQLTGVDLNPRLDAMPYGEAIRYEIGDFMKTSLPDESFKAITSISVIEHGFRPEALLREMSRLLRPSGYFISSFDYWPDKIDTTGTTFFGMDWLIFSRQDVEQFVELASTFGFSPTGPLQFASKDKVISCAGKDYTFATLVLQKTH